EALTFFCDRDDRRCRAGALRIRDNHRRTAAHNVNAGIRGSKVDADHFAHVATPLYTRSVADVVTMNRSPCLTLIRCHLARLKRLPWTAVRCGHAGGILAATRPQHAAPEHVLTRQTQRLDVLRDRIAGRPSRQV